MKKIFTLLLLLAVFIFTLSACSGTKQGSGATHNRGVNNSHYTGY